MPDWTVMIFMAGDNNLSDEMSAVLGAAGAIALSAGVQVVAQFDPTGSGVNTKRHVFTAANPPVVTDLGQETNAGDPDVLEEFIRWGIALFPNNQFMVAISGHAYGVIPGYLARDEQSNDALDLGELTTVLQTVTTDLGRPIDVFGFDTCLMSMAEVCNQLDGSVNLMVSSEGFTPNAGWPWPTILSQLTPATTPVQLAELIVKEHVRFYRNQSIGENIIAVDLSAVRVTQAAQLRAAVTALATALKNELAQPAFVNAIILAHWAAQSYGGELFVDLRDFCERLKYYYPGANVGHPVRDACDGVITALTNMVVESCYHGSAFQYSYGLSIFFPWHEFSLGAFSWNETPPAYNAFAQDTGWNEFLVEYVKKTRRSARIFPGPAGTWASPINRGPEDQVYSMRNPSDRFFLKPNCFS